MAMAVPRGTVNPGLQDLLSRCLALRAGKSALLSGGPAGTGSRGRELWFLSTSASPWASSAWSPHGG